MILLCEGSFDKLNIQEIEAKNKPSFDDVHGVTCIIRSNSLEHQIKLHTEVTKMDTHTPET